MESIPPFIANLFGVIIFFFVLFWLISDIIDRGIYIHNCRGEPQKCEAWNSDVLGVWVLVCLVMTVIYIIRDFRVFSSEHIHFIGNNFHPLWLAMILTGLYAVVMAYTPETVLFLNIAFFISSLENPGDASLLGWSTIIASVFGTKIVWLGYIMSFLTLFTAGRFTFLKHWDN